MLAIAFVVGWIIVYFVSLAAMIALWIRVFPSDDNGPPGWVGLSILIAGPVGCIVALAQSVQTPFNAWRSRKALRHELRRRGIPICLACGYEGGDISAPKCPECGAVQS